MALPSALATLAAGTRRVNRILAEIPEAHRPNARAAFAGLTAARADVVALSARGRHAEARAIAEEAAEWLRVQLADGPLEAEEVHKRARRDGLAERTVRRAKARAGAISEQSRDGGKVKQWVWRLRDPINPLGHVGHVGHLGHVEELDGQGGQEGQDGHPLTANSADVPLATIEEEHEAVRLAALYDDEEAAA